MLAVQSAPLTAPSALGASLCRRRRGRACRPVAALTFRNVEVSVDTHKAALEYGVGCVDITPLVRDAAAASGIRNGLVTVVSKHTTTAVCVNENESRLFTDIQARRAALLCSASLRGAGELGCCRHGAYCGRLCRKLPVARRFCLSLPHRCLRRGTGTTILSSGASARPCKTVHSASHLAPACSEPPPNWKGDAAEWRAQEPINAHAHLASMLVGSSESLPLVDGVLQIGTWQSLLLLELDGPRQRRVGVHIMGE
jgi:thiamine phosphate synthase YjbQ (UPF0047 family)